MNMVLINVDNKTDVEKIFKEIARVLKKNGVLIFSDLHPIMKMTAKSNIRYQKYFPTFSYFKDGSRFVAGIFLDKKNTIEFSNRHWTLETYTNFLKRAGLYIEKIIEPTYGKGAPSILKKFNIPEYILFECKRIK